MKTQPHQQQRFARRGFMLTELIVAAILLAAVLSVITQLAIRSGRLSQDTRHYQMALDEMSNQLDRLLVLPDEQLAKQMKTLAASPMMQEILAEPQLSAEIKQDADGSRIVLQLQWNRLGGQRPLRLVGWRPEAVKESQETPEKTAAKTNGKESPS